jgi:hypothetical protein
VESNQTVVFTLAAMMKTMLLTNNTTTNPIAGILGVQYCFAGRLFAL